MEFSLSSTSKTSGNLNQELEQERDTHLLSIGRQCSHSTCNLVDFLPFKCHHCQQSFCQEHFKVEDHKCAKYDERKHDRIAPSCPLCNTPVSVKIGQDPNIAMDFHLERECSVTTGKSNARNVPICARGNCQKVLVVPMKCQSCKKSFCANHRFPDDHYCSAKGASSAPTSKSSTPSPFANFSSGAKDINSKATAMGNAAMDAMKKSISTSAIPSAKGASTPPQTKAVSSSSTPTPSSSSKPKPVIPFSKMDRVSGSPPPIFTAQSNPTTTPTAPSLNVTPTTADSSNAITTHEIIKPLPVIDFTSYIPRPLFASARARAERESKLKSMQARAKKGLLSEEEKLILASEEAAAQEKGDCIVM